MGLFTFVVKENNRHAKKNLISLPKLKKNGLTQHVFKNRPSVWRQSALEMLSLYERVMLQTSRYTGLAAFETKSFYFCDEFIESITWFVAYFRLVLTTCLENIINVTATSITLPQISDARHVASNIIDLVTNGAFIRRLRRAAPRRPPVT